MTENNEDKECYTELAEKCNKALEMQNKYEHKYMSDITSDFNPPLKDENNKPSLEERNQCFTSHEYSDICKNSLSIKNPKDEIQSTSRKNEYHIQHNSGDAKIPPSEINGVFFARPVNVVSDSGPNEGHDNNCNNTEVGLQQSRYLCFY